MESPRRRDVLRMAGLALVGGLAGCDQSPGQSSGSTQTTAPGSPTATETTEFPGGVFRCRGDPVSVEKSLPASEEPAAYFPSNETVKYVALVGGDDVSYDTMSFERWAVIQTADTAQGPVLDAVSDRLGTEVGTGLSRAPNAEGPSLCVWLFATDPAEIEGTPTPPVTLQDVVETAPRSAHVTLTVDEETFSRESIARTVPVFATHQAPGRLG